MGLDIEIDRDSLVEFLKNREQYRQVVGSDFPPDHVRRAWDARARSDSSILSIVEAQAKGLAKSGWLKKET
jgi:hypothetical protein